MEFTELFEYALIFIVGGWFAVWFTDLLSEENTDGIDYQEIHKDDYES